MSVSTNIKKKVILNIQSCESVQTVYGHEEVNPTGWPAVMVTAGDLEGEFSSNAEDSRLYGFKVQIFFPIGKDFPQSVTDNRLEYAEDTIATVIDEIINVMDTDFELSDSDPTVLYVNASDVIWQYTTLESGETRSAELTLKVYTEITVV